jgi:hypothetical protein
MIAGPRVSRFFYRLRGDFLRFKGLETGFSPHFSCFLTFFYLIPLEKLIYFIKFAILSNMRLNRMQIEHMAFTLVKGLVKDGTIITEDRDKLLKQIEDIIARELAKEDLLDEQVKEILKNKLEEIRTTNVDYYEMFKMVKSKLAQRENIVI